MMYSPLAWQQLFEVLEKVKPSPSVRRKDPLTQEMEIAELIRKIRKAESNDSKVL